MNEKESTFTPAESGARKVKKLLSPWYSNDRRKVGALSEISLAKSYPGSLIMNLPRIAASPGKIPSSDPSSCKINYIFTTKRN